VQSLTGFRLWQYARMHVTWIKQGQNDFTPIYQTSIAAVGYKMLIGEHDLTA